MQGYFEIITDHDLAQAQALLALSGLSLPAGRTYGLGFYEDGQLAACGFLAGTVLCGICVAPYLSLIHISACSFLSDLTACK